jgi:hypothetical protein
MPRPAALLAVFVAALALGCPALPPPVVPAAPAPPPEPVVWRLSKSGLGFRLGDAGAPAAAARRAAATPLSEADAQRVLDRLPPLPAAPEQAVALRDRARPPPRPGQTVLEPFPPPPTAVRPPASTPGPLAVTRRAPVGPVVLAPFASVTFSAPMVALGAADDPAAAPPPVVIAPAAAGSWRWVGAQTAVFAPATRFPMATEFTVKVPAAARARSGAALGHDETWTFTTPPPRLVRKHPEIGPTSLDPVIFAAFDQAIDREALLRLVEVRSESLAVPVRAATDAEIAADAVVQRLVDQAEAGRWLAFTPRAPLAPGVRYEVAFPAGTPSAEGPRRTEKAQRFGWSTFPPLAPRALDCGDDRCVPGQPLVYRFSNLLDEARFDRAWVRVSPEPEGLSVDVYDANLYVHGRTRGKQKYTVTVAGALVDVHGQTLGHEVSAEVTILPTDPVLFPEEAAMSVLDPGEPRSLPIFSINEARLDARLYAVTPDDWPRYEAWRQAAAEGKVEPPPGRLVASRALRPARSPDALVITPLDLAPALRDGLGHVLVIVEPPPRPTTYAWQRQTLRTWIQVTRLGLETFADASALLAWTTRLADGAPLEGVAVSTPGAGGPLSGKDGLARLALPPGARPGVVARQGSDVTFLPDGGARSDRGRGADTLRWLVFDDRHLYKPGEQVHLKGWLRSQGLGLGGDVGAVPGVAGQRVAWTARDARRQQLAQGEVTLDASGGFDLAFPVPGTANLGEGSVELALAGGPGLRGGRTTHAFRVEEFRRPEFEVKARAGAGPHVVGGHADLTVSALYYAGGGLPGAAASWRVRRAEARFVPPHHDTFAFGKSEDPWWSEPGRPRAVDPETWTGSTGASGEHQVRVDFDALDPPYPMGLAASVTVTDVNRQAWSTETALVVHPADVYVGVKQDRAFVRAGEPLGVEVIVTDLDGGAVAGRAVTVRGARVDWAYRRDAWVAVESDPDECALVSAAGPARCALRTKGGGRYRITALVTDAHGRKNQTETHAWVVDPQAARDAELGWNEVRVLPARASFAGGEVAEILVVAPFAPAEGLLTLQRQGVVHAQRFHLDTTTQVLRVTVDPAWTPNVTAHVLLLGATPRVDARGEPDARLPRRPVSVTGTAELRIPPRDRALALELSPRDARLEPGGSTELRVGVRDAAGAPVAGASVAVVVVDEAVLALSAYATPDPLAWFHPERPAGVIQAGTLASVLVASPDSKRVPGPIAVVATSAPGIAAELEKLDLTLLGGRGPPPPAPNRIAVRRELAALALFAPSLTTDAAGHAAVPVKLPDSLTRYRIMAVAVAGERQFGAAEGSLTARLPLMVRPSAPRFLNHGDRFDLPVVVQNQTDAPLAVDLAARAANATLTAGAGRRVTVPAHDRVEVLLPAAAAQPGTARFQIGVASGPWSDAAEVSLPVWTPSAAEAVATYGVVDAGAVAQPVKLPAGALPGFGGVEITTSSTALSALADAVLYLVRYPYACNEQLASRVLAVAALRDVLTAFASPQLSPREALVASVARDLETLRARQHSSGGWSFWGSDREPFPYLSVHVAHALQRAEEKGFAVPRPLRDGALGYLQRLDGHLDRSVSPASRQAILAYALHVRARLGDPDPARARRLVDEAGGVDRLPLEAAAWIWPTLAADPRSADRGAEIRRLVANRVTETAGTAHFTTSYSDGAYVLLHSERRADGVVLDALLGEQPGSDLIPKLVAGLLAHRTAGRWESTQENAFALLALDRYFAAFEKATPDLVARVWLGDRYAGEHAYKGRSTDQHRTTVPLDALAALGAGDVVVEKTGTGRLYYRLGLSYVPGDHRAPPLDRGFSVTRTYEPLDAPGDVTRGPDGVWHVRAGARVRVRLGLVVPERRYHVALVDALPAGLEAQNPALVGTDPVPPDPGAAPGPGWWWGGTWYEHQNLRDERVEVFASQLPEGVYEYAYVARATTPGTFVAPPPRAEEMYHPETFSRGAGERLVVE